MKITNIHIVASIAILVLIVWYLQQNNMLFAEQFDNVDDVGDKYKYCNTLSQDECGRSPNCGYCTDSAGNGQCMPGDPLDPTFYDGCATWQHAKVDDVDDNVYNSDLEYTYKQRVQNLKAYA